MRGGMNRDRQTRTERDMDWYLEQGGLSGVQSGVTLHLQGREAHTHTLCSYSNVTSHTAVMETVQTLTTASTAGDVSPTTSRAGHLGKTHTRTHTYTGTHTPPCTTDWLTACFSRNQTY